MRYIPIVSLLSVILVASGAPISIQAQEAEFPSVSDSPEKLIEAPSEKTIQKAVMRCLSVVDSNHGKRVRGQGAGLVEEGEETYCFKQKSVCKNDPASFSCRSFVKDYVKDEQPSKPAQ